MRENPTLLLGTAGTGTTFGILMSVRERWGSSVRVIGTDMAPPRLVAATAYTDAFVQVPPVHDTEAFSKTLLDLIAAEGVTHYLPTFDPEIVLAAKLRDAGQLGSVDALAPSVRAAEICLDKWKAALFLRETGVDSPETWLASDFSYRGGSVICKPREGVGSVGVARIRNASDWEHWAQRSDRGDFIVQELLEGAEFTLDCFRSRSGDVSRVVCRERLEVKAGVCTKARVFDDDRLAGLAEQVGRALELTGAYCLQVITPDASTVKLTDLNPRPGAGTRLSAAAGVNVHVAMLADAWGESINGLLPRLENDRFIVRQYREIVLV